MYLLAVNKQPGNSRGFTLLELLLAMVITSILVLGMNAMSRHAKLIYSKTETERFAYHKARNLSETLRNDLSAAYLLFRTEAGSAPSLSLTSETGGEVELVFFTLAPSFQTDPLSCRIAKVSYTFGVDENTEKTVLRRLEQPYATEKELSPAHSDIIVSDLTKFEVLALDHSVGLRLGKWKGSYTSKEIPPKALKVCFAWQVETDFPSVEFNTTFLIPCQEPLIPSE